jgi:adenylyl-sulfate kinase
MLVHRGVFATVLDGDSVRMGLCKGLGFSTEGRVENLRRIAHVASLMAESGLVVLCAFISPSDLGRTLVRQIVTPQTFDLVYVNTALEVCEDRDPKGLYAKARRGEIANFTGVSAPYEAPIEPDLELDGSRLPEQLAHGLIEELNLL